MIGIGIGCWKVSEIKVIPLLSDMNLELKGECKRSSDLEGIEIGSWNVEKRVQRKGSLKDFKAYITPPCIALSSYINSEHTDKRTEIVWKGRGIVHTKVTEIEKKLREFAFPVLRTGIQLVRYNSYSKMIGANSTKNFPRNLKN